MIDKDITETENGVWVEWFDYPEKYQSRFDIQARGFFRILDDLYRTGYLNIKPSRSEGKKTEDGKIIFTFEFVEEKRIN